MKWHFTAFMINVILLTSVAAANPQVQITVAGRDTDDSLSLHIYLSDANGPRNIRSLRRAIQGNSVPIIDVGANIDPSKIVFGCIAYRAWLIPAEQELPNQERIKLQMHARYAGTEVVAVQDLRENLWTIEIALTPACDLRLRALDGDGKNRTGFAWTGYGAAEPEVFQRWTSFLQDLDGVQRQLGQARLLGIPQGEDLRVWLHDRAASVVGLNAYRFEPMDIPGEDLDTAVAEIDLAWDPAPKIETGRVQFTGLFEYPGADEEFLRIVMTPGFGYGELLCVRADRQQIVLIRPPDAALFDLPYIPDVPFYLAGNSTEEKSMTSLNCLQISYSADLPAGTWDILPGGFIANDAPTLRRFLADPNGLPGPFPGITRLTIEGGETKSVDLGGIGIIGSTALLSAVWCGPQSGYTVMASPGVGWMPVTKGDSNGDGSPPSPEANQ